MVNQQVFLKRKKKKTGMVQIKLNTFALSKEKSFTN